MPDSGDLERYKERAKEWRDRAASLPEGRERDTCVTIAEGYEKLVEIIEEAQWFCTVSSNSLRATRLNGAGASSAYPTIRPQIGAGHCSPLQ